MLENELLSLEKCKKELHIAKDELILTIKKEEAVRNLLAREQEVISKWTNSANVSQYIREVQGKTNLFDHDHIDIQSVNFESTNDSLMDKNHPSTYNMSTDENYPSIKDKLKQERKLAKLKRSIVISTTLLKK